jgi:hypothetical protein
MIALNVRLILAIPVYILGGLLAIAATITELVSILALVTLDLTMLLSCLIGGAVLAVIAAVCFGIGGAIHGERGAA